MGHSSRWMFARLVFLLVLSVTVARGEDWNQWRGATRDGVTATSPQTSGRRSSSVFGLATSAVG